MTLVCELLPNGPCLIPLDHNCINTLCSNPRRFNNGGTVDYPYILTDFSSNVYTSFQCWEQMLDSNIYNSKHWKILIKGWENCNKSICIKLFSKKKSWEMNIHVFETICHWYDLGNCFNCSNKKKEDADKNIKFFQSFPHVEMKTYWRKITG